MILCILSTKDGSIHNSYPEAISIYGSRFKERLLIVVVAYELTHNIEYEVIGEGSQISTNQKRENNDSWLLIGRNLRPFPDNFVLYCR